VRKLDVTVLQDEKPFLNGTFDVENQDYDVVLPLLNEIEMTHAQAASLLSGYMHAKDVGPVTEEMGKLAMIATVFMLQAGETSIEIPLETNKS